MDTFPYIGSQITEDGEYMMEFHTRLNRKNEETRLDAFEMKGLGKILRVSRTAKKTNE